MEECSVCGRQFKTTQGLSGHMRMVHSVVAGNNMPSNEHVLQSALESAIDNIGEHREILSDLQSNMASIGNKLDGFQRSLSEGSSKPSVALVEHWRVCTECSPFYADQRFAMACLIVADLSGDEKKSLFDRIHDYLFPLRPPCAENKQGQELELSEEVVEEISGEALGEYSKGDRPPQRFLVVCGGYRVGFEWSDRLSSMPSVPDGIEGEDSGYYKVVEDASEADKYQGKGSFRVIELESV